MSTDFIDNHPQHGVIFGVSTAVILKVTDKATLQNSILIGLAVGYGAKMYMEKYGHKLPQDLME
jgi:hypothetical protein